MKSSLHVINPHEQVVNENDNNYQYHLKDAITNTTMIVDDFFIKIGERRRALSGSWFSDFIYVRYGREGKAPES